MDKVLRHGSVEDEEDHSKNRPFHYHGSRSVSVLLQRPEFEPFTRVPCHGLIDPPAPDQCEFDGEELNNCPHPFDMHV
ncbi:hypothetical protein SDC9_167348 [bioreactor metagenome]|uniref:Uncharacterized protein n=1 Tax=bioreactor metagenome TaxID=1076179 RepID=A0A645G7R9_9ZZZZ